MLVQPILKETTMPNQGGQFPADVPGEHPKATASPPEASGRKPREPLPESEVVQLVRRILREAYRSILTKIKEDALRRLLQSSDLAGSNLESQQLASDLHSLETRAKDFEDDLLQALLASHATTPETDPDRNGSAAEEVPLALIDNETFEKSLEAKKLAVYLRKRFGAQLVALEDRLPVDGPGSSVAKLDNISLSPLRIAESLSDYADEISMGLPSRRILFESAKATLESTLGTLYQQVAQELEGLGFQSRPTPGRSSEAPPSSEPPTGEPAPSPADGEARSTAVDQASTPLDSPSDRSHAVPDRGTPSAVGEPTLAGLLARLQPGTDLGTSDLVAQLDRVAETQGYAQGLNPGAQQRTELAGQLWSHLREDVNLASCTDTERYRLQLPLVAAVTSGPDFFSEKDHPLRLLLDRLEQLGGLLDMSSDTGISGTVKGMVAHLLRQLDGPKIFDRELLTGLAARVDGLVAKQENKYQRNVERVVQNCEARNLLHNCRKAVRRELKRRYEGKLVPRILVVLLDAGWRASLEITLLNFGENSPANRAQWDCFDALVQRLGGEPYQPQSVSPDAGTILDHIEQGLSLTSIDRLSRGAAMERLRRRLAEPGVDPQGLVSYEGPADPPSVTPPPPDGISEEAWLSGLERAHGIERGDYILLRDASKAPIKLRFAWIQPQSKSFVLVDEQGLKAKILSQTRLAKQLISGHAKLTRTDPRPLTERAIDHSLDEMRKRAPHTATIDPLTGLYNSTRFQTLLERALMEARQGVPNVLCWIDLDQFQTIRNSFGLAAIDRVLAQVSNLLKQCFGDKGLIAYLGSDHFAVILRDYLTEPSRALAEAFHEGVKNLSLSWEGEPISVTASSALILLGEIDGGSPAVLQAADATLFAAKQGGGNRSLLYSPSDGVIHERQQSIEWLGKVDEALEAGRLELRCQRIAPITLDLGLEPHYEVLLGVRDSKSQDLNIAHFIATAEAHNRMSAVDRWVVKTVIDWAAEHPSQLEKLGGLAINLSGQTMNDEGIIDFVRTLFDETGVAPERISFEVTETTAIACLKRASHIVRSIKNLGCSFALDDFGTGLSSYTYLKELPVDWLKIDGAFVRDLHSNRDDYAVVKSMNEIAHFMGKHTIAEYVENDQVLSCLQEIGVDYAQGYGIEKPRKLSDFN